MSPWRLKKVHWYHQSFTNLYYHLPWRWCDVTWLGRLMVSPTNEESFRQPCLYGTSIYLGRHILRLRRLLCPYEYIVTHIDTISPLRNLYHPLFWRHRSPGQTYFDGFVGLICSYEFRATHFAHRPTKEMYIIFCFDDDMIYRAIDSLRVSHTYEERYRNHCSEITSIARVDILWRLRRANMRIWIHSDSFCT